MRYVFRNIVRFPKKTLVIFILVSVILLLSMSGIFVITLCGEISSRTVGPLGGTVVVSDNDGDRILSYEAAMYLKNASSAVGEVEAIAEFEVQPIGSQCLNGADKITVTYSPYRSTILKMRSDEETTFESVLSRDMKLVAVTTTDICKEFYSGDAELVEGTLISRGDCANENLKIVVPDEFAKLNGLKLGDTVTINALSMFIAPPISKTYNLKKEEINFISLPFTYEDFIIELGESLSTITFTVGGIYHNHVNNRSVASTAADVNDNRVYVPISTVSKKLQMIKADTTFNEKKQGYAYIHDLLPSADGKVQYLYPRDLNCVPTRLYLRLTDISLSDELEDAINEIGFYKEVKLTPFVNEAGASPAAKILIIVRYSLIGVMIAGFAILALIIFFNMNSRWREFAVLAALGMKRLKIALSFFGEVLVVFVASLLVCTALYAVTVRSVAAPVSEYLESSEEAADSSEMRLSGLFSENAAKKQRAESMTDTGYLARNYVLPSLWITFVAALAVLCITLAPVYVSTRKINPLTDSGGKE